MSGKQSGLGIFRNFLFPFSGRLCPQPCLSYSEGNGEMAGSRSYFILYDGLFLYSVDGNDVRRRGRRFDGGQTENLLIVATGQLQNKREHRNGWDCCKINVTAPAVFP